MIRGLQPLRSAASLPCDMVHTSTMSTTKPPTGRRSPAQIFRREEDFFELAERFRSSRDPDDVKKLGDELGRFVFGE